MAKNPTQTSKKNRVGPPYSAITLDTCIYRELNFQFRTQLLNILKGVKIVLMIK